MQLTCKPHVLINVANSVIYSDNKRRTMIQTYMYYNYVVGSVHILKDGIKTSQSVQCSPSKVSLFITRAFLFGHNIRLLTCKYVPKTEGETVLFIEHHLHDSSNNGNAHKTSTKNQRIKCTVCGLQPTHRAFKSLRYIYKYSLCTSSQPVGSQTVP